MDWTVLALILKYVPFWNQDGRKALYSALGQSPGARPDPLTYINWIAKQRRLLPTAISNNILYFYNINTRLARLNSAIIILINVNI